MNQSKIVITDDSKFEEIINSFEKNLKNIKEIFEQEKNNVEDINKTPIWSGPTQEVVYDKHKKLQENFKPIEDGLEYYINFLKTTLENYRTFERETNNSIEQNKEHLTVNS